MKHYRWDDLETVTMNEDFLRKLVAGQQLTIARTEAEKGSRMWRRCYPQETFIVVIDGLWRVSVNGRDIMVGANQLLYLPPYVEHDVEALDRTLALEILGQSDASCFELVESDVFLEDENYLWGV